MYKLLPQPEIHVEDVRHDSGHSPLQDVLSPPLESLQEAIFAADRFWVLEAALGRVDGVVKTACGYYGGALVKPSFREVSEGRTGHTEAVRVIFDGKKISYKSLCKIFWNSHDPTNKDYLRFGVDTHYRSAIFYRDEGQKRMAQESKVERQMKLNKRIVTKILPCNTGSTAGFQVAENAHQKYYLQQHHVWLCESLGLRSTDQFVDSHLACRLNGILGNSGDSGNRAAYQNLMGFIESYTLPVQAKLLLEETVEQMKRQSNKDAKADTDLRRM